MRALDHLREINQMHALIYFQEPQKGIGHKCRWSQVCPVGEAIGDVIFQNSDQLLVNVQMKQRTVFPQLTRWLHSWKIHSPLKLAGKRKFAFICKMKLDSRRR